MSSNSIFISFFAVDHNTIPIVGMLKREDLVNYCSFDQIVHITSLNLSIGNVVLDPLQLVVHFAPIVGVARVDDRVHVFSCLLVGRLGDETIPQLGDGLPENDL